MLKSSNRRAVLLKKILVGLTTATIWFGNLAPGLCATPTSITTVPSATNTVISGPNAMPQFAAGHADNKGSFNVGDIYNVIQDGKNSSIMNVTQSSEKAVINWNSFNVGANGTVNFLQYNVKDGTTIPNPAAATLNFIHANSPSDISGAINSIGSLIFINPNGMIFNEGSVVNAAGIVASTAKPGNGNLEAWYNGSGENVFAQTNTTDGNIIVKGTLNASINGAYRTNMKAALDLTRYAINDYNSEKGGSIPQPLSGAIINTAGLQVATGFGTYGNSIKLIADGDVIVGNKGKLDASTKTRSESSGTIGSEEFEVAGSVSERSGSILLRADQNVNELAEYDKNQAGEYNKVLSAPARYNESRTGAAMTDEEIATAEAANEKTYKVAKVYLNNENANQITAPSVSVYYEADITPKGVKETAPSDIGITDSTVTGFTQKDYAGGAAYAEDLKSKIATSFNIKTNYNGETKKYSDDGSNQFTVAGTGSGTYTMLVNDVFQLQALDTNINGTNNVYGNLNGRYAQGIDIDAADTANWNGGAGFSPIGSATAPFSGNFTGNGGVRTFEISNMHINRPTEDNVGIFGNTQGASISNVSAVNARIIGKDNVGSIVGTMDGGGLSGVSVRKSGNTQEVGDAVDVQGVNNVGGIVGYLKGGSVGGSNTARVSGTENVGGIAGAVKADADVTLSGVQNRASRMNYTDAPISGGVVTGTTNVGGIVGKIENGTGTVTIGGGGSAYNNGQVSGTDNVGGIVGNVDGKLNIAKVFNTNEDGPLSGNSVIKTEVAPGSGGSEYGKVTGTNANAGGLVGSVTGGTLSITDSYNAGNVSGKNDVGGLVGGVTGGSTTINRAYNADNNTVLNLDGGDVGKYYGFTSGGSTYTYDSEGQVWKKDGTTIVPLSSLPDENTRTYFNRLAYRDATVTGTDKVGGLIGSSDGGTVSVNQTYNAGKVTGTSNTGALVGYSGSGTLNLGADGNSVYYATKNNAEQDISLADRAVGNLGTDPTYAKGVTLDNLQHSGTNDWWTGDTNQDDDWIVYNHQAAPLLKTYMNWISINRQYEYDGTVHNLVTNDVNNYYGGAFFDKDSGLGMNVYKKGVDVIGADYNSQKFVVKSGSVESATGTSIDGTNPNYTYMSKYTYDRSFMWSPQHGYRTDPGAFLVVAPKTVDVKVTGEKTYGENAVSGAVLDGSTSPTKYTVTIETQTLTEKGTAGDGKLVYGETVTDKLVTNTDFINTLAMGADDNQKGAGTYEAKNEDFINKGGLTNALLDGEDTHNYAFNFTGTLKVNKAKLYAGIEGEKTYGKGINGTSSDATYKYWAIYKNTTSDNDTLDNGHLKSWDTVVGTVSEKSALDKANVTSLTANEDLYHNTTKQTDNKIAAGTNVKVDGGGEPIAYNLSDAVFKENILANYNVIFDTANGSTGTMKINKAGITYTMSGSHTYGDLSTTSYSAVGNSISGLVAGDTVADVIDETISSSLNTIGNANRTAAGIDGTTDVSRNGSGAVVNVVSNNALDTQGQTIKLKAGNYNYTPLTTYFSYKVNPATIYINVKDGAEKTFGTNFMSSQPGGTYFSATSGGTEITPDEVSGDTVSTTWNVTGKDSASHNLLSDVHAKVNRSSSEDPVSSYTNAVEVKTVSEGNYGTIDGVKLNNYKVYQGAKGDFTINPRNLTVTPGTATRTYGEDNGHFSFADVNTTGLTTADIALRNKLAQQLKGSTTITADTDAGTYPGETEVTYNPTDFANYTVTTNTGAAVINKKDLTATAGNATKIYGNDNSTATIDSITVDGLVAKDAALKNNFTQNINLDQYANVGDYANTVVLSNNAEGDAFKNYNVAMVDGKTTVTRRDVTITAGNATKTYGEDNSALQYTDIAYSGLLEHDTGLKQYVNQGVKAGSTVNADSDAGTYTGQTAVTYGASNFGNYNVTTANGDITINRKALTATAGDAEKVYGDDNSTATLGTYTVDGLVTKDAALGNNFEQNITVEKYADAGTYDGSVRIAITGDPNEFKNYDVTLVNGKTTVDKRTADFTVGDVEREWGTETDINAFTGTWSGILERDVDKTGDPAKTSYQTSAQKDSPGGTYSIDVGATDLTGLLTNNYALGTVHKGTLTITPAELYYSSEPASYILGSVIPAKQNGKVVNSAGQDVTNMLFAADRAALTFLTDPSVARERGQYPIWGTGITDNASYRMAPVPAGWPASGGNGYGQLLPNATALTVDGYPLPVNPEDNPVPSAYERNFEQDNTARELINGNFVRESEDIDLYATDGSRSYIDGGYLQREYRKHIRHITIRSTGIHLDVNGDMDDVVTVEPSSLVNGTEPVVFKVKSKVMGHLSYSKH